MVELGAGYAADGTDETIRRTVRPSTGSIIIWSRLIADSSIISVCIERDHQCVLVGELLAHLEYIDGSIERLSNDVASMIVPFSRAIDLRDTIPGVNRKTAEVVISEIGADMGRFPSASCLVSWDGMCPANNESAGKHFSGKTRRGSKWLRIALVESASAATRMKGTYLAALYARVKGASWSQKDNHRRYALDPCDRLSSP